MTITELLKHTGLTAEELAKELEATITRLNLEDLPHLTQAEVLRNNLLERVLREG